MWFYLGMRNPKALHDPGNASSRHWHMPITSLCLCILPLIPLWGALKYKTVPWSHNSNITGLLVWGFFSTVDIKAYIWGYLTLQNGTAYTFGTDIKNSNIKLWNGSHDIKSLGDFVHTGYIPFTSWIFIWILMFSYSIAFSIELTILLMPYYFPRQIPGWL